MVGLARSAILERINHPAADHERTITQVIDMIDRASQIIPDTHLHNARAILIAGEEVNYLKRAVFALDRFIATF